MAGEAEVAALEESRRAALAAGDIEALSDLIADDYVHVHATALIHDKAAMLNHVRKSPRTVAPRTPKIRVYGDFAILTGEMVNIAAGQRRRRAFQDQALCHAGRAQDRRQVEIHLVPNHPNTGLT